MSDTSISDLSWYVVSDYCIWGKPPFTVSTKKQVKISDSPHPLILFVFILVCWKPSFISAKNL